MHSRREFVTINRGTFKYLNTSVLESKDRGSQWTKEGDFTESSVSLFSLDHCSRAQGRSHLRAAEEKQPHSPAMAPQFPVSVPASPPCQPHSTAGGPQCQWSPQLQQVTHPEPEHTQCGFLSSPSCNSCGPEDKHLAGPRDAVTLC